MRSIASLMCLICVFAISTIAKQNGNEQEKDRFFIYPPDIVLPVIVDQPDCPLEFVKALALHGIPAGGIQVYQVRNRGTKPIRAYTVATVTSASTGSKRSYLLEKSLIPGHIWPQSLEDPSRVIVPLTNELREQYKLQGAMKGIVIFIVVQVEFADGSIYSAEPEYMALKTFFEDNIILPK